ncbi:hypothetical protein Pla52n_52530 [Stieleria varia]|uniref:Uncharacterized protein n=1 Tax=Stieleria varia TaxID=2528005 RepID=A0A5C6A3F0_9BACT|nr:hypothetical protein Pla52n_52530 [Stieleria varia]
MIITSQLVRDNNQIVNNIKIDGQEIDIIIDSQGRVVGYTSGEYVR